MGANMHDNVHSPGPPALLVLLHLMSLTGGDQILDKRVDRGRNGRRFPH